MNNNVPNYWWLNTNPIEWEVAKHEVGHIESQRVLTLDGKKRSVQSHFGLVKPDDIIIGYETTPTRKILAIYKVINSLYKTPEGKGVFDFEIITKLKGNIGWDEIKNNPILQNSAPVKINNRGSIFRLTTAEYNEIIKIIE